MSVFLDRLLRLFHKAENNSSSKNDESFPSSYALKTYLNTQPIKMNCKSNTMVPILAALFDDDYESISEFFETEKFQKVLSSSRSIYNIAEYSTVSLLHIFRLMYDNKWDVVSELKFCFKFGERPKHLLQHSWNKVILTVLQLRSGSDPCYQKCIPMNVPELKFSLLSKQ